VPVVEMPDSLAARDVVHTGEDDVDVGFLDAADQGLGTVDHDPVVVQHGIRRHVAQVGADIRFRHADGEDAFAAGDFRQPFLLERVWRIGGDDAALDADFAKHRHRRDVAALGDFLEHQDRVQDRRAHATVFLGNGHAQYAGFGQDMHVVVGKRAVHPSHGVRFDNVFSNAFNGFEHLPLIAGQAEIQQFVTLLRVT
jgi:hypothetical protein